MLIVKSAQGQQHIHTECDGTISLTARELEVAKLINQGLTNKAIAKVLGLVEGTVKVHVRTIASKLNATNRTQIALWYERNHHNL